MILEACVENIFEAKNAKKNGANQIELCDRLDLDGINPPLNVIKSVCDQVDIPIKVIINPNPYNYIYSSMDIEHMITYINELNKLPLAGIVIGPLTPDGLPDTKTILSISQHTSLPITYHKAIDTTKDIMKSTAILAEQGIVKYILSSGGKNTAEEGVDQLLKMSSILAKSTINLIGAGKITSKNLDNLHKRLNLSFYHGKKIVGDLS